MKKNKILVCMSGGVDSSVVAALLVKQGYGVTGAFMVNYDNNANIRINTNYTNKNESCWLPDYRDALRVAAKLGIPLLKLDFTKEYKKLVLDYMYKEYSAGRTPNPDVLCNKFVKFGVWLDKAKELGFDYLATGHYAVITKHITYNMKHVDEKKLQVTGYRLNVSKDTNKDQTYFLHQLSQNQLKHILFPIGEYTKPEVRKLAKKFDLPTAEKEESMGICFIGEVPMKKFLKDKVKAKVGDIILKINVETQSFASLPQSQIIGQHDGLAFYTIGQRIGMEVEKAKLKNVVSKFKIQNSKFDNNSKPIFVLEKNIKKNELIVGFEDDPLLYKKEIEVEDINWISGQIPKFPLKCKVRLRHRQELQQSEVKSLKSKVIVKFEKPQKAVTPGQFAVFYLNGECLGGGVIK